jgi:hypothetical protein
VTRNFGRATLLLLGTAVLLLAGGAKADAQLGINVTVYNNYWYNASPPIPGDDRIVGTLVESNINHNFDQFPLFNMYEDFAVKYEGFITAPCTCPVEFMAQADDGTKLYLDNVLITNDWRDKGGGGSVSQPVQFEDGVSKQITLWFYENGGGAWVQLWWMVNNQWEIVPATAFTQAASTTTEPATTTSELPTTTTQEPTTTTTVPDVVPTIVETSTTEPQTTTSTSTSTTTTSVVASTTTMMPSTLPPTTTTLTIPIPTSTTTITEPPKEVVDLSPEQATEMATDKETLVEASKEEAEEIFASIVEEELTPEIGAEIVVAVQDAPEEVREAFEEEIDIFAGNTDTYVPVGSTIPVSQRRSLIAVSAVMSVAPLASRRRW